MESVKYIICRIGALYIVRHSEKGPALYKSINLGRCKEFIKNQTIIH